MSISYNSYWAPVSCKQNYLLLLRSDGCLVHPQGRFVTERLFSEWFLIHKSKFFPEFIFHVNYLLSVLFQFCTFPIPYIEKTESVNLVNIFLHFSRSLDISYKISPSLCFQTADMYRLYDINGLPQVTIPPVNAKAKIDSTNEMFDSKPVGRRNFIRENAKLLRTGVSSTVKGAPLMLKNK